MGNKFVAAFLMCIVVVATFGNPAAADCYSDCYDPCVAQPDHSSLFCGLSCTSECEEHPDPGAGRF